MNLKLILSLTLILTFQYGLGQDKELGFYFKERAEEVQEEYPDSAIYFCKRAMEYFWEQENFSDFLECQLYLQLYYRNIGDDLRADSLEIQNWEFAQQHLSPNNPKEALNYLYAATNRASGLIWEGEILKGMELYEKVIPLFEKVESLSPDHIPDMYLHAAVGYDLLGDYEQSLTLNHKVLRNAKFKQDYPLGTFYAQSNIGFTYLERNELSLAKEAFTRLDSFVHIYKAQIPDLNEHIAYLYRGKSQVHFKLDEIDSALFYAQKAIESFPNKGDAGSKSTIYNIIGAALLKKGKYQKAYAVLKKCLQIHPPSKEGYLALNVQRTYFHLADFYLSQNQFREAEMSLSQALRLCSRDTSHIPYSAEDYSYQFPAFETLVKKIQLHEKIEQKNSSENLAKEINLGRDLIYHIRRSFQLEGSKLTLAKVSHSFFEASLFTLPKTSPKDVFALIEEGKSILLYEALLEQEARLGLPLELKKKEKNFKRDLSYYEKSLI